MEAVTGLLSRGEYSIHRSKEKLGSREVGVVTYEVRVEVAPNLDELLVTRFDRRVELGVEGVDLAIGAPCRLVVVCLPVPDV